MVQVEDRQVEPTIKLALDPFNLRVTGYSTAPGTTIGIVTDTKIDKSASLAADLKYALDDGRLEGKAAARSLRHDRDPALSRPLHEAGSDVRRR